jgi:hypothetical protein
MRVLYRDGFLNEGDFGVRLAMLAKLAEGGLKPDFSRAAAL